MLGTGYLQPASLSPFGRYRVLSLQNYVQVADLLPPVLTLINTFVFSAHSTLVDTLRPVLTKIDAGRLALPIQSCLSFPYSCGVLT